MKTTLDLNDALLSKAKSLAVTQRTTLTRVIEEGLRLRLQAPRRTQAEVIRPFPVVRGKGGLMPGIDPCSNRSMLDAADGDDA